MTLVNLVVATIIDALIIVAMTIVAISIITIRPNDIFTLDSTLPYDTYVLSPSSWFPFPK